MSPLEELGESLLDRSPEASIFKGSGIMQSGTMRRYFIQCSDDVDPNDYSTLEEAAKRWLQLKFEGKI